LLACLRASSSVRMSVRPTHLSVCLLAYLSSLASVQQSAYLHVCLSFFLPFCLPVSV
jgi:hypothetical protein